MRFEGEIAGLGTSSGIRIVVGMWRTSPLGTFADVMLQQGSGHRLLLAPSAEAAEFIAGTYTFDETLVGPVTLTVDGDRRTVAAPGLKLTFKIGGPTRIGRLLSLVPRRIATAPRWLVAIDPVARVVMQGVRTRGSAQAGRREYYGAYGVRAITAAQGTWRGQTLGTLAPVDPPVTFGFGSTPRQPAITSLVTTIR